MLQHVRVTAFIVSVLLRENQQEVCKTFKIHRKGNAIGQVEACSRYGLFSEGVIVIKL